MQRPAKTRDEDSKLINVFDSGKKSVKNGNKNGEGNQNETRWRYIQNTRMG